MAAAIYILDVDEFRPLVAALRRRSSLTLEGPVSGYFVAASEGPIEVQREETGLCEAIWFGALTSGFKGRIERFDASALRIVPDQRPT